MQSVGSQFFSKHHAHPCSRSRKEAHRRCRERQIKDDFAAGEICAYNSPMPRRELKQPSQVETWVQELSRQLTQPGRMILIESGALLWHAAQKGITEPLSENSMDIDPITDSDEIARLCYDALIGSEFERTHGWHVNLMPESVLKEFPADWKIRAASKHYDLLELVVPAPPDLIAPKLKRGEPRDYAHAAWAKRLGLID
jgi:hypothetical protein